MSKLPSLSKNTNVITSYELGTTDGMLISPNNLNNRKRNCKGKLLSYVPGHGGDVWFIEHSPNDIAAYAINEFVVVL